MRPLNATAFRSRRQDDNQNEDDGVVVKKTLDITTKYTLGKVLGRGQFGVTHLAVHKRTGEQYAVKTIAKKKLKTQRDVDSLKREVTIMHLLSGHPYIVDVKKVYEDDDNVHIVMELCTGGELFDHIVEKGNYTEHDAAMLVKAMLEVVAHCHDYGVVHRDLKPENFLLSSKEPDAVLKAIDFGVSEFCDDNKYLTDMVGSLYYIAPEVLKRNYGCAVDIWGIGIIAYILLCGEPPFHGRNNAETFQAILEWEVDFKFDPWPSISDAAKDCVRTMLERNPDKRPNAREVLQHKWLAQEGVGSTQSLDNAVFTRMKDFIQCNKLKRLALKLIAAQLPEEETEGLRRIFKSIDADGNGTLTQDELKSALKRKGASVKELELFKLMQAVDIDENGEIDYEEFLAANVQMRKLDSEENMMFAFKKLDIDGNGYITRDEIVECLRTEHQLSDEEIDKIVSEVDSNGDGQIDYMEFQAMMRMESTEFAERTGSCPAPWVKSERELL